MPQRPGMGEDAATMIDFSAQHGVDLLREVTSLPRVPAGSTAEQRHDLLFEEAALIDFVKSFAHVLNSGDVGAVVDNYTDDATWLSPRGRFVGSAEIRRNYGLYYSPVRWFTLWTNVTVRFIKPFDEAYVSAYQYSLGVRESDPLSLGAVSTDVWRLVRGSADAASWKIAERRIDILDSHGHRMLPNAVA
jgi:ketosteroid isomerase-like protein